ncbi:hypothetical protein [Arthrobacter sp. 92]|uniref:hypothetical protein n=1 Tax=Arthrobacter sp. 92 TaxID=3418175 RepID=UPI003D066324
MSDTSSSRNRRIVDELLAEAGLEDSENLRPVLLDLRALAGEGPRPSARLEALMSGVAGGVASAVVPDGAPAVGSQAPVDELAARRRSKRRLPLTALTVAAALAAGGAAAAASDEGIRNTFGNVQHAVTNFVGALTSGTGGHSTGQPASVPGGAAAGTSSPAPNIPSSLPPSGTAPTVHPGQGGLPSPAETTRAGSHIPEVTLPSHAPPTVGGTVPGTGRGPDGRPLPSPGVSLDPSGVPTAPVQLPLPGQPTPTPRG